MQATLNIYAQDIVTTKANPAAQIIRREATKKIMLFSGILACLVLAINF